MTGGRPLGPIREGVGQAHRAWLVPLRTKFLASGLTIGELAERSSYAKSKISVLLRGEELYPRWEMISSVLRVLEIPGASMQRLWIVAAREAKKKDEWIRSCIGPSPVAVLSGGAPLDHRTFMEARKKAYKSYARVFLHDQQHVDRVFARARDILWLRWNDAPKTTNVTQYAWGTFRRVVMDQTPHRAGYPELRPVAFDTTALAGAELSAQFAQIEESLTMMTAISRLPAAQLDVVIFKHFRRMTDAAIVDVLGVAEATVGQAARYARRQLQEMLGLDGGSEGPFQWR